MAPGQGVIPVAVEGVPIKAPHVVSALILRTDNKNDQVLLDTSGRDNNQISTIAHRCHLLFTYFNILVIKLTQDEACDHFPTPS